MVKLLLTTVAFVALSFSSPVIALIRTASSKKSALPRRACSAAKLKLRDCHLQIGTLKIQVWNDKIFVQDEFARGMVDLPLKEAEWIEVSVQELGGRKFLEFVAWDAPQGQGEVATKKWYVYELQSKNAVLRLEKSVQRRKHVDGDRFNYDRLEKFGLGLESKKIKWSVGREKGYLE